MTLHSFSYAWTIGEALGIIFVSFLVHVGVALSWGFAVGYFILVVYKKLSAYYSGRRIKR